MTEKTTESISYRRNLSPFVLENMLVDYCKNKLDQKTHAEIEREILSNPSLANRCKQIELALSFCETLGQLRVRSDSVIELTEDLGLHKISAYYRRVRPRFILGLSLVVSFILSLIIYKLIKMYLLNE